MSVMNEFAAFPEPEAFVSKPVNQKDLIDIAKKLLV